MGMTSQHCGPAGARQEMIALCAQPSNEELVAEALAPLRDQLVIAAKFGFKRLSPWQNRRRRIRPARARKSAASAFADSKQPERRSAPG